MTFGSIALQDERLMCDCVSLGLSTFATPKIDTLGLPRLAHLASPKSTLDTPKLTH